MDEKRGDPPIRQVEQLPAELREVAIIQMLIKTLGKTGKTENRELKLFVSSTIDELVKTGRQMSKIPVTRDFLERTFINLGMHNETAREIAQRVMTMRPL